MPDRLPVVEGKACGRRLSSKRGLESKGDLVARVRVRKDQARMVFFVGYLYGQVVCLVFVVCW